MIEANILSPLITIGAVGIGILTLVGFWLAAKAYVKAKSVEALDVTNDILNKELEAMGKSRDRMQMELSESRRIAAEQAVEMIRLGERTDLMAHQRHLDVQHGELVKALTRVADESERRNGMTAHAIGEIAEKMSDIANIVRELQ